MLYDTSTAEGRAARRANKDLTSRAQYYDAYQAGLRFALAGRSPQEWPFINGFTADDFMDGYRESGAQAVAPDPVTSVRVGDAVQFFTTAGCYRPAGHWQANTWHAVRPDQSDADCPFPVLALVTTVHPGGFFVNLRVLPESQFVGVEFGVPHDPYGGAFTWRERG